MLYELCFNLSGDISFLTNQLCCEMHWNIIKLFEITKLFYIMPNGLNELNKAIPRDDKTYSALFHYISYPSISFLLDIWT